MLILRGSHNVETRFGSYLLCAREREDTRVSSLLGTVRSNSRIKNYARMRILYVHTFAREITRYSYVFLQSVRFSSPTDSRRDRGSLCLCALIRSSLIGRFEISSCELLVTATPSFDVILLSPIRKTSNRCAKTSYKIYF